jgi:Isocitrate/isopropylmalate dehydrogenase
MTAKKSYTIAVLGGDGTGPEVIREGRKAIDAAAKKEAFSVEWVPYDLGGERYMRTGEILPESVLEELRKVDAIYLGAVGHPDVKPGVLEKGLLLRIRFELDQYINLRPVRLYRAEDCPVKDKGPKEIDYCVIRENSGGLYTGIGGISRPGTKTRPLSRRCFIPTTRWSAACATPSNTPESSAKERAASAPRTRWPLSANRTS